MNNARFPRSALTWLVGSRPSRVLNLGGSSALPKMLAADQHRVFTIDKDFDTISQLATDVRLEAVAAEAESLPFDPCQFDAVTAHQVFHKFAPGLVLSEMARVLKPGGRACVSYLVRDDSVPWVRRLISLMRSLDEEAMSRTFGDDSVTALEASKYFPSCERKSFRVWVPMSRSGLLSMAANSSGARRLDGEELEEFLLAVGRLYDESASGSDTLKLPYQLKCWRAHVDHAELTAPIQINDTGLVIPL